MNNDERNIVAVLYTYITYMTHNQDPSRIILFDGSGWMDRY